MSSDIEKFLAKINEKEKKVLIGVIEKILQRNTKGLDVKKLAGHDTIFRVRKGNFRIIFKVETNDTKIILIDKRSDTTYNF